MSELFFLEPFSHPIMKRALVACVALSVGAAPVGVFLILRRMSLMGDALSHALLPGAALGYTLAGLSLFAMGLGGFIAGLIVALLAGIVTRRTQLEEDASFAGFFLISLALGILIISLKHRALDLMHILFGTALAVDTESLIMIAGISSFTLLMVGVFYRPLILEGFEHGFLNAVQGCNGMYHLLFLLLVVLNLVSGFQTLGTLLSLGMMMLPALSAQFWSRHLEHILGISVGVAAFSGYVGLLTSYHCDLPSGPCIVLTAGIVYIVSLLLGPYGSALRRQKDGIN